MPTPEIASMFTWRADGGAERCTGVRRSACNTYLYSGGQQQIFFDRLPGGAPVPPAGGPIWQHATRDVQGVAPSKVRTVRSGSR
eukprot:scaffold24470_cov129-Isochrysis_galbana.AAC.1